MMGLPGSLNCCGALLPDSVECCGALLNNYMVLYACAVYVGQRPTVVMLCCTSWLIHCCTITILKAQKLWVGIYISWNVKMCLVPFLMLLTMHRPHRSPGCQLCMDSCMMFFL